MKESIRGQRDEDQQTKTQLIDFGQYNGQGREPVKILAEEPQWVHHFTYIGSSVEETVDMATERSQRVSAGWRNWNRYSEVLCDRRMPVKLKGEGLQNCGRTSYVVWCRDQGNKEGTLRMVICMCGVTWRDNIRNERISGTTRVMQASTKITEKQLK